MSTITHNFEIDNIVWYVTPNGIQQAKVLSIDITVTLVETNINYHIRFTKTNETKTVDEVSLFTVLSGTGSALEAYQAILES